MSLGTPCAGRAVSSWTLILHSWLLCEALQWWMHVWESGDHNVSLPHLSVFPPTEWCLYASLKPNIQWQWHRVNVVKLFLHFHFPSGASHTQGVGKNVNPYLAPHHSARPTNISHIPVFVQNADLQKKWWKSSHKTFFHHESLWYGHKRDSSAKMLVKQAWGPEFRPQKLHYTLADQFGVLMIPISWRWVQFHDALCADCLI